MHVHKKKELHAQMDLMDKSTCMYTKNEILPLEQMEPIRTPSFMSCAARGPNDLYQRKLDPPAGGGDDEGQTRDTRRLFVCWKEMLAQLKG